jgi:hypothetical protein
MMALVLIKSYQDKWVIFGQELTENNRKKREFGHNTRSATSWFCSVGTSLLSSTERERFILQPLAENSKDKG